MMAVLGFFLSPVGRWLAGALVALLALTWAYHHVKGIGYAQCKAEWTGALVDESREGEQARTDAERDVRDDTPDSVRNDPWNRDNWKK